MGHFVVSNHGTAFALGVKITRFIYYKVQSDESVGALDTVKCMKQRSERKTRSSRDQRKINQQEARKRLRRQLPMKQKPSDTSQQRVVADSPPFLRSRWGTVCLGRDFDQVDQLISPNDSFACHVNAILFFIAS